MKLKLFALHPQSGWFFVSLALLAQLTKVNSKKLGPPHARVEGQALFVQAQVLKKCKRYTSPLSVKPVGGQLVSEAIALTGAGQAFLFPIAFAEVNL